MNPFIKVAELFEAWIDPFRAPETLRPPNTIWAFVWHYVRQAKLAFLALMVLNALSGVLEAAFLFFVGRLVDILDGSKVAGGWQQLMLEHGPELVTMLTVVVAARFLVVATQMLVDTQVIDRGFYNLVAWQAYTHVARQSFGFFANRHSGSILTKVGQAGTSLGNFVTGSLSAIWTIATFVGTSLVLFGQLDLRLAAVVVIWIGLVLAIAWYFLPRMRRQASVTAEASAAMNGRIVDVYSNIQTVKLFSSGQDSDAYMRASFANNLTAQRAMGRLSIGMQALMTFISSLAFSACAIVCIELWAHSAISVGAVAFALALVLRLNMWLGRLIGSINGLLRNFGVLQNSMETVSQPIEVVDLPDAIEWSPAKGGIRFENVSFHYLDAREVVENFSLDIRPGEKIGLVGKSGVGKTTVVNLLLRFYDLQSGRILIDGQDISLIKQDSLRACIGVVTQDTSLLHRSVRDNIRYGKRDASENEIIAAAKKAEAHDFILELKDPQGRVGYDAHVGERGIKLSGGQRQRVAIARVILKNAPILVLDEATSALDSEIEAAIQDQLAMLVKGKTVVAIAHRLSTIAAMDRLVVMDAGRIVEQGSHAGLLAQNGIYAGLWRRQSGGFIAHDEPAVVDA